MRSMGCNMMLVLSTVLLTLAPKVAASYRQFTIDFTSPSPLNSSSQAHHAAVVTRNGTTGQIVLAAAPDATCHGTPAYFNTIGHDIDADGFIYGALDFDLTACSNKTELGVYGAFAGDVGEVYGLSYTVSFTKYEEDFSWLHTGDSLLYRMAAASDSFFACNVSINGETRMALSWGVYQEIPAIAPPVLTWKQDINSTVGGACPF
nr:hypothetical protein B0A51_13055 [Rachicladosporium sp. CCFEE 5018]